MGRIEPPLHPELTLQRHLPIPLEERNTDQHFGRPGGLLQTSQKGGPFGKVLEDVRKNEDIEPAVLAVTETILNAVFDARMLISLARRLNVLGAEVDAHHPGARSFGDIEGDGTDAAAYIQHPFALSHSTDKEVVVAGVPVLGMGSAAIFH